MTKEERVRENNTFASWFPWIIGASVVAMFLVVGAYVVNFEGSISQSTETWGQFGDYIGGALNPIFGFLALLGLLLTISLQSRELSNSTRELKNSADALNQQNIGIAKQTFETAFFNLLQFQNDILKDIDIRADNANASGTTIGRDCFKVFHRRLRNEFDGYESDVVEERIIEVYRLFYESNQADVGHYFRHLYHIIKFVDRSDVEDPSYYIDLVRAQLSVYELGLLFYNCLTPYGSEKFKPLIEKYALLKNMPYDVIFLAEHKALYTDEAYGPERPA
tara:strand:+ start:3759 stop:4592 length:834 start_codon:yes stop_codon:yes gene_type:complete